MSHFTEIKTQIKDIVALRLACQEMGLTLLQNTEARGYYENKIRGDYVVQLKGPYDIALNKQPDGTFGLTADIWNGHVEKEVGQGYGKLLKLYGVHKARSKPGRGVYPFFAGNNKTGPSNSCSWGCHEQNPRNHHWDHRRNPN